MRLVSFTDEPKMKFLNIYTSVHYEKNQRYRTISVRFWYKFQIDTKGSLNYMYYTQTGCYSSIAHKPVTHTYIFMPSG